MQACVILFLFIFVRAINITETNNTNAEKYDVSFQTIWLTAENSKCMNIQLYV